MMSLRRYSMRVFSRKTLVSLQHHLRFVLIASIIIAFVYYISLEKPRVSSEAHMSPKMLLKLRNVKINIEKHTELLQEKKHYQSTDADAPKIRDLCSNNSINTLFFVHTRPSQFSDRRDLRANLNHLPDYACVFMLGLSTDEETATNAQQESAAFGDMVIFNSFVDTYRNLTLKFVNSIRWIHDSCGQSSLKFIVKLDDDAWINLPMLSSYLNKAVYKYINRIHCLIWRRVRVVRRMQSKWYVSKAEYPEPFYPPYCGGLAYILPINVLNKLVNVSYTADFFWIDDVFGTGILPRQSHIGLAQISRYYAMVPNDSAQFDSDPVITMRSAFGTTEVMFSHMYSKPLRALREYLFDIMDGANITYPQIIVP